MPSSLDHLQQHHGDFEHFRELMSSSAVNRFNAVWWGIWSTYIEPKESAHIIDLGTGPGNLLCMLRSRFPQASLSAVEVQPAMLREARAAAAEAGAALLEHDLSDPLPFGNESADVITAVMVLHELLFPPALITEMHRVLAPGGKALIYDWVKQPLSSYLGDAELDNDQLQHFREHCLLSAADLEFLFKQAGFTVLERIDRRSGRFSMLVVEKSER